MPITDLGSIVFERYDTFTIEFNNISNIAFAADKCWNVEIEEYFMNRLFLSGNVFSQSFLDVVLCQTFYNKYLIQILEGFGGVPVGLLDHPPVFEGKRYIELFEDILTNTGLCIGIKRLMQIKNIQSWICINNPDKEVLMKKNDKIFVILHEINFSKNVMEE